jgi:hypothetical protein
LVAGKKRVPTPATGNTIFFSMVLFYLDSSPFSTWRQYSVLQKHDGQG